MDKAHSEVNLKVRHMMISNVTAGLKDFDVKVDSADDTFKNVNIEFVAKAHSINTNNKQRDDHLRSEDFLHADVHPEITFIARGVDASTGKIAGDLTIRGVTKKTEIGVDFAGIYKDPYGNNKAGFSIDGKIKRSDFGLEWNAALEAGGVVVGDDVRLLAEIQLTQVN